MLRKIAKSLFGDLHQEQTPILADRLQTLSGQIPTLYVVVLANVIGLFIATNEVDGSFLWITIIVAVLLLRLRYWLRFPNVVRSRRELMKEFRSLWIFAAIISLGFSVWAQILMSMQPEQAAAVGFFGSLAALGCSYGLINYLAAARLPLLVMGLPLSIRLLSMGSLDLFALGIGLGCVIVLVSRLLLSHQSFQKELLEARHRLQTEKDFFSNQADAAQDLANCDALTQIPNRRAASAKLTEIFAADYDRQDAALFLVDLDGFKPINDTFGHPAGDYLLKSFATRLMDAFGSVATVARIGGDEFCLIFEFDDRERYDLEEYGDAICAIAEKEVVFDGIALRVKASCGYVRMREGENDKNEFVARADAALYAAKTGSGPKAVEFNSALEAKESRRLAVDKIVQASDFEQNLKLEYRAVFTVKDGDLSHLDCRPALYHARLGKINSREIFLSAARLRRFGPIARFLQKEAIETWKSSTEAMARMLVPLSLEQICDARGAKALLLLFEKNSVSPEVAMFEVLERDLYANEQAAKRALKMLRGAGAQVLLRTCAGRPPKIETLQDFAFDAIEVDARFVTIDDRTPTRARMVVAFISYCRALGLQVVVRSSASDPHSLLTLGIDYVRSPIDCEDDSVVSSSPARGPTAG